MSTLGEKETKPRARAGQRAPVLGPIMLLKATQLVWLGFTHGSCSQNPTLIQTRARFSPAMEKGLYVWKGSPRPRQAQQVGAEPIPAVMKAAAAMLSHEDSWVSRAELDIIPQASGVGSQRSLHPAFALCVCTSVSFTELRAVLRAMASESCLHHTPLTAHPLGPDSE